MEKIITYDQIPSMASRTLYLRDETDPNLRVSLVAKGFKVVDNIVDADPDTIFVTGRRQAYICKTMDHYKAVIDTCVRNTLKEDGIVKPFTVPLDLLDLYNHKYKLPFVLKNENQNGGREKFLIETEGDYENLLCAIDILLDKNLRMLLPFDQTVIKGNIDYGNYLIENFHVQEYIENPTEYNTTVRLLTSSSNDLLYAVLKYKKPEVLRDRTSLIGFLLSEVYPLSTPSIVSNTLSGGSNILLGEAHYDDFESKMIKKHNIDSEEFAKVVQATKAVHEKYSSELGIICGFDYIYDRYKKQWFLLEYHSRPMLGDYSRRQGIKYDTKQERQEAEGRIRATALSLTLKKTR